MRWIDDDDRSEQEANRLAELQYTRDLAQSCTIDVLRREMTRAALRYQRAESGTTDEASAEECLDILMAELHRRSAI